MKKLNYKEAQKKKNSNIVTIGACFIIFTAIYATISITKIYKNKKFIETVLKREMEFSGINDIDYTFQKIFSQIEREGIPIKESDFTIEEDQESFVATIIYNDSFSFFKVPIKEYQFVLKNQKSSKSE